MSLGALIALMRGFPPVVLPQAFGGQESEQESKIWDEWCEGLGCTAQEWALGSEGPKRRMDRDWLISQFWYAAAHQEVH